MSLRRLTRAECEALDEALAPHDLTPILRWGVEIWLTSYRDRAPALTPKNRTRWRNDERRLVATAEALLALIARASPEDAQEALQAGTPRSPLSDALALRIDQWRARARAGWTMSRPFNDDSVVVALAAPGRPAEQTRRDLLRRVLGVLRDSGLSTTSGEILRRQTVTRVLGVVLQIADTIDGKATTGTVSTRLVRETMKGTKFGRATNELRARVR